MPFRLSTFGGLVLTGHNGRTVDALGGRRLTLLAVLAAAGDSGVSRESLGAMFWPESDAEHARRALNQALYTLRQVLGPDAILGDAINTRLAPAHVASDVGEFQRAVDEGEHAAAAALYRGQFLDGVHVSDAPEFERWSDERREHFQRSALRSMAIVIDSLRARSEWSEAVLIAERAWALDPSDTDALMRLMEISAAAGSTAAALRAAGRYETWMRAHLSLEPDPRVGALAERLRRTPAVLQLPVSSVGTADPAPASQARGVDTRQSDASSMHTEFIVEQTLLIDPAPWRRRLPQAIALPLLLLGALLVAATRRSETTGSGRALEDSLLGGYGLASIAVDPPTNLTGRQELDAIGSAAQRWIALELTRLPAVSVSEVKPRQAVPRPPGVDAVRVSGAYALVGDSVVVTFSIAGGSGTQAVRIARLPIGTPRAPLALLPSAASQLAVLVSMSLDRRLGPLGGSGRAPASLETFDLFREGLENFFEGEDSLAFARLESAQARDTMFLTPSFYLVNLWSAYEQWDKVDSTLRWLQRHAVSLSPSEALQLSRLDAAFQGDYERALALARRQAAIQPSSPLVQYSLIGGLISARRPAEALAVLTRIERSRGMLSSGGASELFLHAHVLHILGRHGEAYALVRAHADRGQRYFFDWYQQAWILATLRRSPEVVATVDSMPQSPEYAIQFGPLVLRTAAEAVAHGDSRPLRPLMERVLAWCPRFPGQSAGGMKDRNVTCARAALQLGRLDEARRYTARVIADRPASVEAIGISGLIAAATHDTTSERVADARLAGYVDVVRQGRVEMWRAMIAITRGDTAAALTHIEEAARNGWNPFTGDREGAHRVIELASLVSHPRFQAVLRLKE